MTDQNNRFQRVGASLPKGLDRSRKEMKFGLFGREFLVVRLTEKGKVTDQHILLMEKYRDQWCSIYVDLKIITYMETVKIRPEWQDYELVLFLSEFSFFKGSFDVCQVIENKISEYKLLDGGF